MVSSRGRRRAESRALAKDAFHNETVDKMQAQMLHYKGQEQILKAALAQRDAAYKENRELREKVKQLEGQLKERDEKPAID